MMAALGSVISKALWGCRVSIVTSIEALWCTQKLKKTLILHYVILKDHFNIVTLYTKYFVFLGVEDSQPEISFISVFILIYHGNRSTFYNQKWGFRQNFLCFLYSIINISKFITLSKNFMIIYFWAALSANRLDWSVESPNHLLTVIGAALVIDLVCTNKVLVLKYCFFLSVLNWASFFFNFFRKHTLKFSQAFLSLHPVHNCWRDWAVSRISTKQQSLSPFSQTSRVPSLEHLS